LSTRVNTIVQWPSGSSEQVSGSFSFAAGNTLVSNPVSLPNCNVFAMQLVFSSSLTAPFTGSVKLEGSCDAFDYKFSDFGRNKVSNWSELTDSSHAISGSGGYSSNSGVLWDHESTGIAWVRAKVTRTAGSGSFTLRAIGKGPST
jgi:hypothetical protein